MGQEQGRRQGLGEEVRRVVRRGDLDQGNNAVRHQAADVVVADMDMPRLAGNLGGFRQLDAGAVVLEDRCGVRLG